MSDMQTASLVAGLVLLVAVGARYFVSRPTAQVRRDAFYWAIIIAVIAIGWAIYGAVVE